MRKCTLLCALPCGPAGVAAMGWIGRIHAKQTRMRASTILLSWSSGTGQPANDDTRTDRHHHHRHHHERALRGKRGWTISMSTPTAQRPCVGAVALQPHRANTLNMHTMLLAGRAVQNVLRAVSCAMCTSRMSLRVRRAVVLRIQHSVQRTLPAVGHKHASRLHGVHALTTIVLQVWTSFTCWAVWGATCDACVHVNLHASAARLCLVLLCSRANVYVVLNISGRVFRRKFMRAIRPLRNGFRLWASALGVVPFSYTKRHCKKNESRVRHKLQLDARSDKIPSWFTSIFLHAFQNVQVLHAFKKNVFKKITSSCL